MRVTGRSTQLTHADQKMIFAGFDTAENLLSRREASTTYQRGKRKGQQRIKTLRGNRPRGQQYHDHCSCVAIPVRAGSTYEPPDYAADWEDDYIAAKRAARAAGETRGKHGAIDETAVLRHMDHIERDRKNGITAAPIEMVDIELKGPGGQTVTRRVPADSPAARVYAADHAKQDVAPATASGGSGGDDGPPPGGTRRTDFSDPGDDDRPPKRAKGMLGPQTPDEFGDLGGYTPPARRSDIDEFTSNDAHAVLYGDGSGHGGHAHDAAGTSEKSRYPANWRAQDVIDWVSAIVDSPGDGYDDGSGFSLFGLYREVSGVLRVRRVHGTEDWHVATAHPLTSLDWTRERS